MAEACHGWSEQILGCPLRVSPLLMHPRMRELHGSSRQVGVAGGSSSRWLVSQSTTVSIEIDNHQNDRINEPEKRKPPRHRLSQHLASPILTAFAKRQRCAQAALLDPGHLSRDARTRTDPCRYCLPGQALASSPLAPPQKKKTKPSLLLLAPTH